MQILLKKIKQIPLTRTEHDDFQLWGEPSGIFSIRSAYKLLQQTTLDPSVVLLKKTVSTFSGSALQQRKYGEIYSVLGCLIATVKAYGSGLPGFSTRGQVNSVVVSAVGYGLSGQVDQRTCPVIYFDAAFDQQSFRSATGLIVQAMDGEILAYKSVLHVDVASPFAAEALAGLEMTRRDFKRAVVAVDWPGGNYGQRTKEKKGKEIVGQSSCIGLKDKASGLVYLEVEQGKAGQGRTHGDLILENNMGFNSDGSQPISTGKLILNDSGHLDHIVQSGLTLISQNKNSSLHINPTFEGPIESEGCTSLKFIRVFHEYNQEHKPDLISLIETRVSRGKADLIIAKLGFHYSQLVEAVGFSGGIWIGWKESVGVKVLKNHLQFVLVRITGTSFRQPLLVTFVYASPNQNKRRILWEALQKTILMDGSPWMAIGDFNAIISPSEKKGAGLWGKCTLFLVSLWIPHCCKT
ncbi:hypothetical protein PVK06_043892 [Gossypium arboreum]|uniref:Endonuclease/exonuclease/phosphatase domain-containing protein n=1 Tax=Gossypium arboreum TaxID=29729 RepID=A0ABR0MPL9_GOSAR|nr:hypothetical protein PVK06_043892 [Gossypium arboreum]